MSDLIIFDPANADSATAQKFGARHEDLWQQAAMACLAGGSSPADAIDKADEFCRLLREQFVDACGPTPTPLTAADLRSYATED